MPPGYGRGGGGRGRGMRRRWGRRMRIVEPMMLLLLAKEPMHGYGLVERLDVEFSVSDLPPQTVYRALQGMEERGWVLSDWDVETTQGPPRKVYRITDSGWSALEAWSHEIEDLRGMLDRFLTIYHRERPD